MGDPDMLQATALALGAALLHALWNLAVKASTERWLALWGQFTLAGVACLPLVLLPGGLPAYAWWWASLSGIIHVAYCAFLARAYDLGDFSTTYPIARGTGALLAAGGGVLLLGDRFGASMVLGIALSASGLYLLAGRTDGRHLVAALGVALSIGIYTTIDTHGARLSGSALYPLCTFVCGALALSAHGFIAGRGAAMARTLRTRWRALAPAAAASVLTYWMVLQAVRLAPVGYVTALRESSVVIAALLGCLLLGEGQLRRRVAAALVVFAGLAVLVSAAGR